MSEQGSVTRWIEGLKAGDSAAARCLWEQYYRRLVGFARRKLGQCPRRVVDEEDVVQGALASFCRGAREGRFPNLHDRQGLWPLLVRITECKAYDHLTRERRRERKVHVAGESAVMKRGGSSVPGGLDNLPGPEPTPDFAAAIAESVQQLLAGVPSQRMLDPRRAIWFAAGRPIAKVEDAVRGIDLSESPPIDDPVLESQRIIQEKLGPHCVLHRAISFASRE